MRKENLKIDDLNIYCKKLQKEQQNENKSERKIKVLLQNSAHK